jgi:branched-chain amino acid transport system substrate-binding protein
MFSLRVLFTHMPAGGMEDTPLPDLFPILSKRRHGIVCAMPNQMESSMIRSTTLTKRRTNMKKIALLFAATVLLFVLAAGSSMAEIKVGIMVPTTGSEATYGKDMENAIKMAVDELNAKGGVLGQKFTTVTGDDGCDPQMSTAAASKIVAAGVDAVVGGYCSGATLPTLKIYSDAGIPIIVPAANSTKFIDLNPGNAFLINAIGTYQVDTAVDLFKKLGVKKIAIIHQGDAYSEDLASLTKKRWTGMGNEVVAFEVVNKGEQDQSALVTRLKSKAPDLVFWTAYYADGALFIKQMRQGGYKGKIVGGDGMTDVKLIEIAGKSADGVYSLSNPLPEFLPEGKKFVQDYKAKFKVNPGPYSALSYDGMYLLADAIKRAGSTDKKAVAAALKATKAFKGISGPISFTDKNLLTHSNFVVLLVKGNKFTLAK